VVKRIVNKAKEKKYKDHDKSSKWRARGSPRKSIYMKKMSKEKTCHIKKIGGLLQGFLTKQNIYLLTYFAKIISRMQTNYFKPLRFVNM